MIKNFIDLFSDKSDSIVIHWIGQVELKTKRLLKDYQVNIYCEHLENGQRNYSTPKITKKTVDAAFLCDLKMNDVYTRRNEGAKFSDSRIKETYIEIPNPFIHLPETLNGIVSEIEKNDLLTFHIPEYQQNKYTPCIHLKKGWVSKEYQPISDNFVIPCFEIARYYYFKSTALTRDILYGDFSSLYYVHKKPTAGNNNIAEIDFKQGFRESDYKVLTNTALSNPYFSAINYIPASLEYVKRNFEWEASHYRTRFPYVETIKLKVKGIFIDTFEKYFLVTRIIDSTEYIPCEGVKGKYFADYRSETGTDLPTKEVTRNKPTIQPTHQDQIKDLTGELPHNSLSAEIDLFIDDNRVNEFNNLNFDVIFPEKKGQEYRWVIKGLTIPTDSDKGSISQESARDSNQLKANLSRSTNYSPNTQNAFSYFSILVKEIRKFKWDASFDIYQSDKNNKLPSDEPKIVRINSCFYSIAIVNSVGSKEYLYLAEFYNGKEHHILTFFSIYFYRLSQSTIVQFFTLIEMENFNWRKVFKDRVKYLNFVKSQHRKDKTMSKNAEFLVDKMESLLKEFSPKSK